MQLSIFEFDDANKEAESMKKSKQFLVGFSSLFTPSVKGDRAMRKGFTCDRSLPALVLMLFTMGFATMGYAAAIDSGATQTGNISSAGQLDSYSFSAANGDTVTILMGKGSGALYPKVELHAPNGTVIAQQWGYYSATIEAQPVALGGVYYIVCRDYNGTQTGTYGVSLIKNPGSTNTIQDLDLGTIKSGETKYGTIGVGDLDAAKFAGKAGDTATVLVGKGSGALYPKVELHAQDGTVVAQQWGYYSATIEAQSLEQNGTYFIICRDYSGTQTGTYGVSLIKNPGTSNSKQDPDLGTIRSGETKYGTIGVGDLDAAKFAGQAGDTVTVLMGKGSGALYPLVELHGPNGAVIAQEWGYYSASIEAQTLAWDGMYYIVCRDYSGTQTGTYGVSLIKNPGGAISVQDRDLGAIRSGQTKSGTIGVGDLDAAKFTAHVGQTATILMGKVSGAIYPLVELHAPDGTVIAQEWGYYSATIEAQPLEQNGTYYIICRDYNGTQTGNYAVSLTVH
jgi:hypothetical protein